MVRMRKAKGKQWRKGHSCESNPKTNVHRSKMRRGMITGQQVGPSSSNLTTQALEKHNASHDSPVDSDGDEGMSMKSAGLFSVGGLTDCSNPVFDNVKRFWNAQSSHQKEVCAVLAAVTEVIKSEGGKETETEYFAALMTALESSDNEESMTAITYLLTLVIKSVPESILKTKFSKASQILLTALAGYAGDGGTSLLRSLLYCLSRLLLVQESAVWSESSTMKIYHGLLSFTIHSKPKIRKGAQDAVETLLKKPPNDLDFHPAAGATAKFCVQQIQQHGGSTQSTTTLHVIGLLKEIISLLPIQSVKTVCENLLKLMTLGNVMVTVNSLQVMFKLFTSSPSTASLSVDLNAQIINALYDYQPNVSDVDLSQAWISTMEKAYINLSRNDNKLCTAHLPRCFSSLMSFYLSEHKNLAVSAANSMKELLRGCIEPSIGLIKEEVSRSGAGVNTSAHKIIKCIESGLKYRYHDCWNLILEVITVLFEILGKDCSKLLKKMLVSLCDLHGTYKFQYTKELKRAVGMAIQKMGPRNVLECVPLNLDKPNHIERISYEWETDGTVL
ncbi:RRP12-like protein [Exaiptasia diaphana]|nr:RRP12-like protein [Exaiptasia diaphana]